jgi:hypothetical protein
MLNKFTIAPILHIKMHNKEIPAKNAIITTLSNNRSYGVLTVKCHPFNDLPELIFAIG